VYVDHCALLSGGELALLRTLPELRGVDAHVILGEEGPLAGRLESEGISHEVLALDEDVRELRRAEVGPRRVPGRVALRTMAYVDRLRRRLRALAPDLVHANSLKSNLYGTLAARAARVPVVAHVRDRIAPDYLPPRAVPAIRFALVRLPTAVIVNSRSTLEALSPGRPKGAAAHAHVLHDPYRPAAPPAPRAAAANGSPLTFGVVGRIMRWKGQDVFLRAFAQAFASASHRAVIVGAPFFGEEDYERELRGLAADLGVAGRVDFTGFVEDVPAVLESLDVLVHTSVTPEPFGQVIVEGMAAGVPVVAAGAGGPREIIEHGRTGLLYEPGDSAALAAVLRSLAGDAALRDRLAQAGRERSADFSPADTAARLRAIYESVLAGRASR
jgi:glycosyltransferase involved in cell wall biosynthesis